jgi:hypothetical protein
MYKLTFCEKLKMLNRKYNTEKETMTQFGVVFLIQPPELKGCNRYQIGVSSHGADVLFRRFKPETRFISIMECENYEDVESLVLTHFRQQFQMVAGRKFFEGDEEDIREEFMSVVIKHRKRRMLVK